MPSMINFSNFTRAFTAFCLVVFIYILIPDTMPILNQGLKFGVLIGIVLLLMFYNQLLKQSGSNSTPSEKKSQQSDLDLYSQSSGLANELYENLKSLVLSTATAINSKVEPAIYMIDPESQVFSLQGSISDGFADGIPISNKIVKSILNNTNKIHQKDHPDAWNELFKAQSWRGSECVIGSTIKLHGSPAGFILAKVNHFSDLTEKDSTVLESLGNFISHSLVNLESLEKHVLGEESKTRILELLSNLNYKSDQTQILDHFKYLTRTFFYYDRLTISLKKDEGTNSVIKLVDGIEDKFIKETEFPTHGTLHGLPISTGESIQSKNWKEAHHNLVRFDSSEEESDFLSVLGVPILVDGVSKGSLFLERITEENYSKSDRQNLELIGRVLGASFSWILEYEKIYLDATHDGLSGLLNHKTFKDRFAEEIQRAKRFQHNMVVLIFDLDKFKRINDTLGHQYGDYVIKTVSGIMADNVRTIDVVARYGGEEFAIILVNTTAEMAFFVAQRIVNNIANYQFTMDGEDVRMAISGGMSEYPTHSEQIKDLIEYADQAMYDTKQNGGNGVMIYQKNDSSEHQAYEV